MYRWHIYVDAKDRCPVWVQAGGHGPEWVKRRRDGTLQCLCRSSDALPFPDKPPIQLLGAYHVASNRWIWYPVEAIGSWSS